MMSQQLGRCNTCQGFACRPSRRTHVAGKPYRVLASKGFGPETKKDAGPAVKVSKRGTLASRSIPSPPVTQEPTDPPASAQRQSGSQDIEEVPQEVNDRILGRILLFSGVPVLLGFSLYPLFYYLKVTKGVDLPMWVVYVTQGLVFGGGLLGITYAIVSASWDPRRKGSALGLTEFRANLPILLESLRKSKG